MRENVSFLISSCDKFSDLWDEHIKLYKKNWIGDRWKTYIVTDKPTEKQYEDVEIIVAGENLDFPMRIKYALERIETDFIFLTLDDYFLIEPAYSEKLNYLAERVQKDNIDYLMLYNRRRTNKKKYEPLEVLLPIELNQKYAVTLYPAIWSKDFLKYTIKEDRTAWQYEPLLTKCAFEYNANCQASLAGTYDILDVVRKGKVLHKAQRYFKKNNIDIGNRPSISYATEAKLAVLDVISWYTPRKLFKAVKKVARKFGMTFYSED